MVVRRLLRGLVQAHPPALAPYPDPLAQALVLDLAPDPTLLLLLRLAVSALVVVALLQRKVLVMDQGEDALHHLNLRGLLHLQGKHLLYLSHLFFTLVNSQGT